MLASELDAPVVFVYVRRGPSGLLGTPLYQRRLSREMQQGRHVLGRAVAVAELAGVEARGEILEGSARHRIAQFARDRGAQLIVVGSRRRRLGRSVAFAVARAAELPNRISRRRGRCRTERIPSASSALPRAARRLSPASRPNQPSTNSHMCFKSTAQRHGMVTVWDQIAAVHVVVAATVLCGTNE